MGKRRMIDMDGLCFDPDLTDLGLDACMFYIRLWSLAEDWGGVDIEPRSLLLQMGGMQSYYDVERIDQILNSLIELNKIIIYESNNKKYGWIKNFAKHQNLNIPAPPKLPLPEWIKWHPKTSENKVQYYEIDQELYDRSTVVQRPLENNSSERPFNDRRTNRIEVEVKEKLKEKEKNTNPSSKSTPLPRGNSGDCGRNVDNSENNSESEDKSNIRSSEDGKTLKKLGLDKINSLKGEKQKDILSPNQEKKALSDLEHIKAKNKRVKPDIYET